MWCRPRHQKAFDGLLVALQTMLPSARDAFWRLTEATTRCVDLLGLNTLALRTNARYRASLHGRKRHTETYRSDTNHSELHVAAVLYCATQGGATPAKCNVDFAPPQFALVQNRNAPGWNILHPTSQLDRKQSRRLYSALWSLSAGRVRGMEAAVVFEQRSWPALYRAA